ncbi:hypothetical protein, partial [Mesorhizobium sp. M4B.F.Ca.ET.215.01.1.1]
AEFLGNSHNSLKMLRRLEESPDKMRGLLSGFVEQVEKLREEKQDNPMEAMEALLSSFLEAGMRELKG